MKLVEGVLPEPKRPDKGTKNKPRPHGDYETEWLRCTQAAKEIYLSINKKKIEIARLAISVCDIEWGGGSHWDGYKDKRTLKQFSIDSGIAYRTLHTYTGIVKSLVDRLPEGEYDPKNWGASTRSFDRIRKLGTSQLEDGDVSRIYSEEINRKGSTSLIRLATKNIKTVRNHLQKIDWELCSQEEVDEFQEMLDECTAIFNADIEVEE